MTETKTEIAPGITGTIDFDELLYLLQREIQKEDREGAARGKGPQFIYNPPEGTESCVNVYEVETDVWQPSCLIGRVLWNSGKVEHELLIKERGSSANNIALRRVWADSRAEQLAVEVQTRQDGKYQWGHALLKALVSVGYYKVSEEFNV